MPRLTVRDMNGKLWVGLLEIQICWRSAVIKPYIDRPRLLCVRKLRYVVLRVFTFLLVHRSLKTVLEAIRPSVLQFEDSSWDKQHRYIAVCGHFLSQPTPLYLWHLIRNHERELGLRAQKSVLKRKHRVISERVMVQDFEHFQEVRLRYFKKPPSVPSLSRLCQSSDCNSIYLSTV